MILSDEQVEDVGAKDNLVTEEAQMIPLGQRVFHGVALANNNNITTLVIHFTVQSSVTWSVFSDLVSLQ